MCLARRIKKKMEDCEAGKIDFIMTKSISRLSRNTADCLELVRRLMELHIPIYFEKENLNTSDMEGEFLLSTLSSLAESESVSISENSKWSIQNRFQDGTYKLWGSEHYAAFIFMICTASGRISLPSTRSLLTNPTRPLAAYSSFSSATLRVPRSPML